MIDGAGVSVEEVLVKCDKAFTLTNGNGSFDLFLPEESSRITFSKTGFTLLDTLLKSGEEHHIVLKRTSIELDEVAIEESRKKDEFLAKALKNSFQLNAPQYRYEAYQTTKSLDSLVHAKVKIGYLTTEKYFQEKIVFEKQFPTQPTIYPMATGPRWLSENFITEGALHPSEINFGERLSDYKSIFLGDYLFDGLMTKAVPSIYKKSSYTWSTGQWVAFNKALTKQYEFALKNEEQEVNGKIWVRESDTTIVKFSITIGQSYLNQLNEIKASWTIGEEEINVSTDLLKNGELKSIKYRLTPSDKDIAWRSGAEVEYDLQNSVEVRSVVIDSNDLYQLNKFSKQSLEMLYDSMDNEYNELGVWDYIINGISYYNHRKRYRLWMSPLLEQTNIIGIGGYRHTLEGTYQQYDSLANFWKISAWGDYGFSNNDPTGRVRLQRMYNVRQFAFWGVSAGSMYQFLSFGVPLQDVLSRSNYVRNDYAAFEFHTQVYRGWFWWANTKFSDRKSIDNLDLAGWSDELFGEDNEPLKFEPYQEWIIESGVDYTPFQKVEVLPFQERLSPSKYPTISVDFEYGVPKWLDSDVHYLKWEIGLKKRYRWLGSGNYKLFRRDFIFANSLEFPNFIFLPGNTPFLFISPDYALQLLENTIRTDNELYEIRWLHHFDGKLLSYVPLLNSLKAELLIGGGGVWQPDLNYLHAETYYGIEIPLRLSKAKYKLGFFHVIRPALSDAFRQQFKFGINFFNAFTSQWEY